MELKVVFFLILIFFVGLLLYYIKYDTVSLSAETFNYSAEDSLFNDSSDTKILGDSVDKIVEKRVDSEPELLDFRTRKLSEGVNPTGNLAAKVNINNASIEILTQLPGIGQKTAEKIVAFRNEIGGFKNIAQLKEVKGIGEAKFNRIKELIFIE